MQDSGLAPQHLELKLGDEINMRDPETMATPLQELQHSVVVKGVEGTGQLAFLRLHRCGEIQGHTFNAPLPLRQGRRLGQQ